MQYFHSPKFYEFLRRSGYECPVVEVAHNRTSFAWDCTTYPRLPGSVLVCVSPCAKEHYIEKRGEDVEIVVIPNGVDTDMFYPAPVKPERRKLVGGFCGRLEGGPGKGVEEIVNIVAKLPVNFELVGYDFGNYGFKTKGIPNIKVMKHTPKIADHYRNWDFFLSCSPKEGFGLAIAEALACGLPSILLDCGGVCRYLKHGKHAYIAKDLKDVEKGLQLLIDGELNLQPLAIDFSAKTMTDSYMKLYKRITAAGLQEVYRPIEDRPSQKAILKISDHVLGVVPSDWQGIKHALESKCTSLCDPKDALRVAKEVLPSEIIFGGFNAAWLGLARELKKLTKCHITITYHGTAVLDEFHETNRNGLIAAITAAKEGTADVISCPHEGMVRALNWLYKVTAIYEPNKVSPIVPPDVQKLDGFHIGLFGTGMPWKNMDTQILAAAITPGMNTLHLQNAGNSLLKSLGIGYKVHPYYRDREEFYKLAATMKINLAVTITETFGYFCLESFMLGVPAIVGATTPSMRGADGALKKCIVNHIDDPAAISDAILEVMDDYDNVLDQGRRLCKRLIRSSQ